MVIFLAAIFLGSALLGPDFMVDDFLDEVLLEKRPFFLEEVGFVVATFLVFGEFFFWGAIFLTCCSFNSQSSTGWL